MAHPADPMAAWQKAALDSTLSFAQTSLASAEKLLKINLDAARKALEQAGKNTRDLLAVSDPKELAELRAKIAQANLQQSATYAQNIYEIVSQTQALLAKLGEEQYARLNQQAALGADKLAKTAPGADAAATAIKSTLAATNAMMDNLNRATKQFAELSETSIRAATAGMFKGKKK